VRGRILLTALRIASAALAVWPGTAPAQTPPRPQAAGPQAANAVPRTSWGDPDLQGTWIYATMTPFERPAELAGKPALTPDEEAAYLKSVFARQRTANNTAGPDWWDLGTLADGRTSLIVDPSDGKVPPLTAEAQRRDAAKRQRGPSGWVDDIALNIRCIVWPQAGPPMLPGLYNNNVQIFQTRQHIVILNEMIHDARIVPLDGRPHGGIAQWMGDSRGHWEGGTLVIDTVKFSDKANFRGSDANLHLVERLTRVGPQRIDYAFTVEDPTVWTLPWSVAFPLRLTKGPIYEYACHEGNERSIEAIVNGAGPAATNPAR
jgi:hypothetical protein